MPRPCQSLNLFQGGRFGQIILLLMVGTLGGAAGQGGELEGYRGLPGKAALWKLIRGVMKVLQRIFRGSSKIYRLFISVSRTSLLVNSRLCKGLSYYAVQRATVHSRKLSGDAKQKPIQNKNCKNRFRLRSSNSSIPFEMLMLAYLFLKHRSKLESSNSIMLLTVLSSKLLAPTPSPFFSQKTGF